MSQVNEKNQKQFNNWEGKIVNILPSIEKMRIANKHAHIPTTSLRIRELQIKPMVKFHFNLKTGEKNLCVAMKREGTVI